jgi:ribosomal protein L37AE/L43A
MSERRAWSLIATGKDRQYGGNQGYDDDPSRVYRYDSDVANHKQLAAGDLVLIRNRSGLLGVATIETIKTASRTKNRQRCPKCDTVDLKRRKTIQPEWRCDKGHTFSEPAIETIEIKGYEARFENTYVATPDAVPASELKLAAMRRNDQLSIEELNIGALETRLTAFPGSRTVLARFAQTRTAGPHDSTRVEHKPDSTLALSMFDTREQVLRAIKVRRGQFQFRERLLKRYENKCAVSGCTLLDILEAAHVWPYRGEGDNHPENGLLLRADLHTLFDLDLMAIDPASYRVCFHPLALTAGYEVYNGATLGERNRPAREPLHNRWYAFQERLNAV